MTLKELRSLRRGDIVRNVGTGQSYVILFGCSLDGAKVAVREATVSNPDEWEKVEAWSQGVQGPHERKSFDALTPLMPIGEVTMAVCERVVEAFKDVIKKMEDRR